MPQAFVTTSWDDDDRGGLKIAELLNAHHLPGTFYVPTGKLGTDSRLSPSDLRNLSGAGFEIGAHTVSHPLLPNLNHDDLIREVSECKKALQQIISAEVTMFCYPRGRCNSEVIKAVKDAGYRGARGAQMLAYSSAVDPFAIPVTIQAYPHRRSNYIRSLLRRRAYRALLKATPDLVRGQDWLPLGRTMFDRVLRHGGIWHVYGHSAEIEKLNLWGQVRQMLEYVSHRSNVVYITNGQIIDLLKEHGSDAAFAKQRPAGRLG